MHSKNSKWKLTDDPQPHHTYATQFTISISITKYNNKMMMKKCALLLALASSASAVDLTPDNYETETAGKSVFLKFFAPW
mmetsp:Transcript_24208/g.43632  ORF Transcript_24208/g.43632 Transcript_24208/m.43632 type:complete len:80 (+) Transcript_24208:3-242(+)